jgi:putative phosphoesterase
VRLVLTADTHVPRRARDLPSSLWSAIDTADVVVHAGDWVDVELLDRMDARARRLVAVTGNNDDAPLRARLPEVVEAELGGVRLVVVHETGQRDGRERRIDLDYAGRADVVVFGHSHIPWDTTTPSGIRLLNPGSPTDRRRQPTATYMTARIHRGTLREVTLVPIPSPGPGPGPGPVSAAL